MSEKHFWETTPLSELSDQQWESLCDGCGKCCLLKLQDEDTDEIVFTNVCCDLFDLHKCSCSRYPERSKLVPDCLDLRPNFEDCLPWLPSTCAYRLIAEGKPLFDWHPLLNNNKKGTMHDAGASIQSYAVLEKDAGDDISDHILDGWLP